MACDAETLTPEHRCKGMHNVDYVWSTSGAIRLYVSDTGRARKRSSTLLL